MARGSNPQRRSRPRGRRSVEVARYAAEEAEGSPNGDPSDEELELEEFEGALTSAPPDGRRSGRARTAGSSGETIRPPSGRRRALHALRPSVITGGASAFPLLVLFGLNAADELDRTAFGVLLPEIRDWFGVSLTVATAIVAITGLFTILVAVPMGYLSDRVNRTRLAGAGASTWGVFSFLTAFAPSAPWLAVFRFGSGAGRVMDPAHNALLADYYPPHVRGGVFAFHRAANSLGQFFGPLLAGWLAVLLFWQAPFLLFAAPGLILSYIAVFKLREPVRGEQERRAQGASEKDALLAEQPPSWTESWRVSRNVRTLRRIWYALPFIGAFLFAMPVLLPTFYREVFGLGPGGRGTIAAFAEPFQIAGLIVGGLVANRFLRYKPGRVITYIGLMAILAGLMLAVTALAPILPIAVAFAYVGTFTGAILGPAATAVMTLVIPPRVRGFALSVGTLFLAPGFVFAVIGGALGDAFGVRTAILMLLPVFVLGALIIASAGSSVEPDIRQANAGAMALLTSRRAKDEGQAKLLVVRDLDVHYGSVQVLFNVDFEVEEGELIALLGTNGAGKSTLLNAISGTTPPSNGATFFDGEDITYLPANDHAARGIVQVPGGRGVFSNLTVAENLRLAAWMFRSDHDYVREATDRVFSYFPVLRTRLDEPAGNLSGGEQQMLGLGQAFLSRPRLLMIDELSLGLAPAIVEQLLEIVRAMHELGTTVILVEQSVNIALTVADRAVFMEKGEVRFSGPTRDLLRRPDILRAVYLKGAGGAAAPAAARTRSRKRRQDAEVVLEVSDVHKRFGGVTAVDGVDLTLEDGKILGVIGPNGAGKTTLFDVISGFIEPDEGRIVLAGQDITGLGPDERARLGLQRSFQDARLFPSLTVVENIAVALERYIEVRNPVMGAMQLPNVRRAEAKVRRRVDRLIDMFNLGEFRNKFVRELSTGTRRICDLACIVAASPKVILLDEPSSGIAQAEAEELGPLLERIRYETGCSMLVIEHDMPLITSVSDELVALHLGAVVTRGLPAVVVEHPTVVESYLGTTEEVIRRSGRVR